MVTRSEAAVENGRWPWRAPIGHKNVVHAPAGQPNIVPDPEKAPLVARALQLVATCQCRRADVLQIVASEG